MGTDPKERIDRIMREIKGVVSQYGVTDWELRFMESLQNDP